MTDELLCASVNQLQTGAIFLLLGGAVAGAVLTVTIASILGRDDPAPVEHPVDWEDV